MTLPTQSLPGGAIVASVSRQLAHGLAKPSRPEIRLLTGLGVEADAHCGSQVKHRYLAARDPNRPNLRQVHLIEAELQEELTACGYAVGPGDMGENITTYGLKMLALPPGTLLRIGGQAVIAITGLRDPCRILNRHLPGLMNAVTGRMETGEAFFRGALMATVQQGGVVRPGDAITLTLPPAPFQRLAIV